MIPHNETKIKKADVWTSIKNSALDLLLGKKCFFCGRAGSFLCEDCATLCDVCLHHRPHRGKRLDDLYVACTYDNRFVKKLIRSFKYEPFLKTLALPLASLVYEHLCRLEDAPDLSGFTAVAVPIAPGRRRWRGYDQAEALAHELARLLDVPVLEGALKKTRETPPQAGCDARRRAENMKETVACASPGLAKVKKMLLVDDVFTTGATMEECARALKECGAQTVVGIAVARAEPGRDSH